MKNAAIEQFEFLCSMHRDLYKFILEEANIRTIDDAKGMSIEELTDLGFMLKRSIDLLEDLRKEMGKRKDKIAEIVCMAVTMRAAQEATTIEPVRTEYCTASPRIKNHVRLPKRTRDPETYDRTMTSLGVPLQLVESGIFALNWNAMADYLDQLKKKGLPVPEGVNNEVVVRTFELTYRGKREIGTTTLSPNEGDSL